MHNTMLLKRIQPQNNSDAIMCRLNLLTYILCFLFYIYIEVIYKKKYAKNDSHLFRHVLFENAGVICYKDNRTISIRPMTLYLSNYIQLQRDIYNHLKIRGMVMFSLVYVKTLGRDPNTRVNYAVKFLPNLVMSNSHS